MSNNCIIIPKGAVVPDALWSNVVLFMPMDGLNGASSFIDLKGHPITKVGSPTTSTVRFKFDPSSGLFPDLMDQLLVDATDGQLAMGSGDFTIEGFTYLTQLVGTQGLFQISSGGYFQRSLTASLALAIEPTRWQIYAKNANNIVNGNVPAINSWFHWALERFSGTTSLYVNGVSILNLASDTTNYTSSYFGLNGIWDNTGGLRTGNHDEVRVTRGQARYKGPFTPPSSAFGRG